MKSYDPTLAINDGECGHVEWKRRMIAALATLRYSVMLMAMWSLANVDAK
jgi:hypothetical protein